MNETNNSRKTYCDDRISENVKPKVEPPKPVHADPAEASRLCNQWVDGLDAALQKLLKNNSIT